MIGLWWTEAGGIGAANGKSSWPFLQARKKTIIITKSD
jgi:hypothetical protein